MNVYVILLVILVTAGRQILAQDNTIDTDDGYRFERYDAVTESYDKAQEICKKHGIQFFREGWVVRIKNDVIQNHVENVTSGLSKDYYIGLRQNSSGWYWNDGTSLTEENWVTDDEHNEGCACVQGDSGKWRDVPCTSDKSYICQSDLIYIKAFEEEETALEGQPIKLGATFGTQGDPAVANLYKLPDIETSLKNATKDNGGTENIEYKIGSLEANLHGGEYLFVVTTQDGATNYNRTAKTRVSVDVPAHITNVAPTSIHFPVTNGSDQVTCIAEGTPPPTVRWKRSKTGEVVSSSKTKEGVYQTLKTSTATLHVESANSSDHGVYTCFAKNSVSSAGHPTEDTENITLSVYGKPEITSHDGNKCGETGSITVIWKPDKNTRNCNHSVEVMNVDNCDQLIATEIINPNENETVKTIISDGLSDNTNYSVVITVCPDLCIQSLNDTVYQQTEGGLPNAVTNGTLADKNFTCVIKWEWKDTFSDDEITFVISESATSVYQSTKQEDQSVILNGTDCNREVFECDGQFYQITRTANPNTNYTYTIATKTCAGKSEKFTAVGECATEYAEPSAAPKSEFISPKKDKLPQIQVNVPDETNGPVSCIFVVMVRGDNPNLTEIFTVDTLARLSSTAQDEELQENEEYLAVAIQRSNISGSEIIIDLGDGKTTSCYPGSTNNIRTDDYTALNRELANDVRNTYYTLTSTPLRKNDGIAFGRSEPGSFTISVSSDNAVPVGAIAGSLGGISIIGIIVGLIYYCKVIRPKNYEESTDTAQDGDDQVDSSRIDIWNVATIATVKNPSTLKPSSNPAYKHDPQLEIAPENHSPTTIHKQQMRQKFEELNKNKGKEFESQFKEIKRNAAALTLSSDIASDETRKQKNRYKNVLPYDNTRVKLKGTLQDDYINACYINGHHALNKFIATQGPTDATIEDFWKMVAGERTKVIVMLTNVVEAGKRKCEKYWPDISQDFTKYGDVSVMNTKETYYGGFMKRTFRIKTPDVRHDRTVEQLQYLKWPDHGIPVTTSSFVRLHKECVKCQAGADVPIIVHCSAGAGRTGTFIGYDYLLEELGANGDFDVYNCVTKMREQRMDMVQTCGQYKLLHRLLLEEILFGNTDSDESQFNTKYPSDERVQKSLAQEEFKKIEEASSIPKILENEVKDFEVIIRWYPEERENIARYDASYVENYYNEKKVIAARSPVNEHDRELFWRVVLDNEVKYIVMLDTKKPVPYWPQQNGEWIKLGKITVWLTESHDHRHTIERRFGVTREGIEQEVVQYQMMKWSPDVIKNTIEKVTGAVNTAMRSLSKVVVHCCNGRGRTGTFCASINLLERLNKENHVDVFRAVKDLRDCRDGMVQNESQYRMCYKTIAHSMDAKETATYAGLGDEASQGTSMIQDQKQNREAYENHSVYSKKSTTKV